MAGESSGSRRERRRSRGAERRYSRQTSSPDWDQKDSPGHRRCDGANKRKRRSLTGPQEKGHSKRDLSKRPDSTCSETKSINERGRHERQYVEEYRNEYNQRCDTGHHSSKSSGYSGTSSYKRKYKTHHTTCPHRHSQVV